MTGEPVRTGPAPLLAPGLLVGAVVLLLLGLAADPAGRLLAFPAAVLLLVLALRDLALRPVLAADGDGLQVVSGVRRLHLSWEQVHGLRVVTDRRADLLEVDLGSTVVVLGRARLGAAPQDVLAALSALQR